MLSQPFYYQIVFEVWERLGPSKSCIFKVTQATRGHVQHLLGRCGDTEGSPCLSNYELTWCFGTVLSGSSLGRLRTLVIGYWWHGENLKKKCAIKSFKMIFNNKMPSLGPHTIGPPECVQKNTPFRCSSIDTPIQGTL